jgi:hypothetical protein
MQPKWIAKKRGILTVDEQFSAGKFKFGTELVAIEHK